jgi:hypothetical protein
MAYGQQWSSRQAQTGPPLALRRPMDLNLWWRKTLANWLLLAELDWRLAQRTLDGSARARRRYAWALEQLRQAERAVEELL